MTTPVTEALTVTQADRKFAADWNYECKHCSEYEGDFEADLAAAVAEYRIAHTTLTEPVLRWEGDQLWLGGEVVARVSEEYNGRWFWDVKLGFGKWGRCKTLPEAKTAAEQAVRDWLARAGLVRQGGEPFQTEVDRWMDACFGKRIRLDLLERADRFIEEALELAQTVPEFGADRAHALVDYVFGRPVGERAQEVGGVMVTLAALCNAAGVSIDHAAKTELARVWTKVEAIRAKQAAKPTGSALPVAHPLASPTAEVVEAISFPVLRPAYSEDHPILAAILDKRRFAASQFTPEFSGTRGQDFDRGLLCAYEAVNAVLQEATAALAKVKP